MSNWFSDMSTRERRTFWACFSGWALDAMDVQLYAVATPTLIGVLAMSRAQAGMLATSALTAYLFGGMAGILAGGFLAARTSRHDRVAASGLLAGAVLLIVVATAPLATAVLLPLFATVGFVLGVTGPSRDLIVRNATPKGAAGRVYGFVYSGLDIGGTIGPVLLGFMLDHELAREMFFAIAACLATAIGTVVRMRRASVERGTPVQQAT